MNKNILVTSVGGRSVGSGVLHSLTRSSIEVSQRWNIIAADADPFSWGLYKVDEAVILPFANSSDYIESLLKVIEKYKIEAIIPGSEPEVNVLSSVLSDIPIPVICNAPELIPLMMDKNKMLAKLKELGLKYIATYPINEWENVINNHNFPFILKPTIGTGGSRGLYFVSSKNEITNLLPSLADESKYCIQPYIGSGEDEYTVGVLTDKNANIIDSIVMKRKLIGLSLLHSKTDKDINYKVSTGYSQGFIIKHEKIQTFCENLALSLKSTGPLNIQLRLIGDEIYVFEIHPRFSGTSPMRADVGFNEADILLRNRLYDENFGRLNYKYDVAAIRAFEHVIVPIDKLMISE